MRTTVTLEEDVAAALARLRRKRKLGFKEALNQALRVGIQKLELDSPALAPFRVEPHDLGRCQLGEIVNVSEALALAEGEDHP